MAKNKDKAKKKPVSPSLLEKLRGSVSRQRAFPAPTPPAQIQTQEQIKASLVAMGAVSVPTQEAPARPPRKAPNRTDKFQLVVRIPDDLAEALRDGAYTSRESQTDIVERAIRAELGVLRSQFPQFLKAPPPKNTRSS